MGAHPELGLRDKPAWNPTDVTMLLPFRSWPKREMETRLLWGLLNLNGTEKKPSALKICSGILLRQTSVFVRKVEPPEMSTQRHRRRQLQTQK